MTASSSISDFVFCTQLVNDKLVWLQSEEPLKVGFEPTAASVLEVRLGQRTLASDLWTTTPDGATVRLAFDGPTFQERLDHERQGQLRGDDPLYKSSISKVVDDFKADVCGKTFENLAKRDAPFAKAIDELTALRHGEYGMLAIAIAKQERLTLLLEVTPNGRSTPRELPWTLRSQLSRTKVAAATAGATP